MKEVNFTHFYTENFGKFQEPVQHELGHKTIISGKNGIGKSTIKRMIMYALGCRDENGKEISGIRPHDENGVDIDGLIATAQLTVSVDGAENTLKKTYFQKKNRQGEYTGESDTQHFIDGVKKGAKKDYDAFVQSFLPDSVCINAQEFFKKDTAGRRAMLNLFSKHTDSDIISENPEFEEIRGKLNANATQDLKKSFREQINGTKGRNAQEGLNDKLTKIIHQIEFEEAKKKDIDVAELELQRNSLKEQIADVESQENEVSKQYEEYDKLSSGILELKFNLNGLQQKANEEMEVNRRQLNTEIASLERESNSLAREIMSTKDEIENLEDIIQKNTAYLESAKRQWKEENNRVFDENGLTCHYCGQAYPEEKKNQLRNDFETYKAERLKHLTDEGTKARKQIDNDKPEHDELKKKLPDLEKKKSKIDSRIDTAEKQYNAFPQSIDISDREDVKAIEQQISEKEESMNRMTDAKEIRQQLSEKKADLQHSLIEVEMNFKAVEENNRIDDTIVCLKKQQVETAQEIADLERQIDLIERFEHLKAKILEQDVNENFDYIQVKMHEKQVNGDYKEVCQILVDGTNYDSGLNYSDRLLAEIDLCRGFQRMYDIQAPILLDNAESINDSRIPDIENQLIVFKVSEEEGLKVEVM